MGSKNRHAKEMLPIILKDRKEGQCYVEPMVGGANMIDKVDGWRIGADNNYNVILALEEIKYNIGRIPKSKKDFTEKDYNALKLDSKIFDRRDISYTGFALSYGGKWFGGWRRDKTGKRDYVAEAYRNALRQSPLLQDILLIASDYKKLNIPSNSIVYCDIPYEGTTGYKTEFNHIEFWEWCRQKSTEGHQVFISEYKSPDDFECVWSKKVNNTLTKDTGSKQGIEKLFTFII